MAGYEVWLVTRANNVKTIFSELRATSFNANLHIVPIDLPKSLTWWKTGQRGVRAYYILWQYLAYYHMLRLHREIGFHAAHHLTLGSDWLPASVLRLPIPSIWGPVGGSTRTPFILLSELGTKGVLHELARTLLGSIGRRVWGDMAARRADVVLANNADVQSRFRSVGDVRIVPHARIQLDSHDLGGTSQAERLRTTHRAVFVGRLIPWKGLTLAMRALAEPAAKRWSLRVIGDGPDRDRSMRLAEDLGIANRIEFLGRLPRGHVLREVREADALLHPAIHDSAPFAIAEAVSLGTSVVCLDRGGSPILAQAGQAVCVPASRHIPRSLSLALQSLESLPCPEPSNRWSVENLPNLVSDLYEEITSRHRPLGG